MKPAPIQPAVLRRADLRTYCGVTNPAPSRTPGFPRQIKIGARASGWLRSEVDQWIAERVAERDARAAA